MGDGNLMIGVVGAGSWGTAVANLLAKRGYPVVIWCREKEVAESINTFRENRFFLKGVRLDSGIRATNHLSDLSDAEVLINAVPVQFIRSVWENLTVDGADLVVNLSKGIEVATGKRVSQVLGDFGVDASRYAVLSGPSFALEVAHGKPTAVTVAAEDEKLAKRAMSLFNSDAFRVYAHTDVVGVEIAGALKNVMAIASGISDGLGLGLNARASLINRGLVEMARLGVALGAQLQTFWGLAGMGDLVLTCTGDLSRNRRLGLRIGKGERLEEILASTREVVEGVETVRAVVAIARDLGVEMPISFEVYSILFEGKDPLKSVKDLLNREPKFEFGKG